MTGPAVVMTGSAVVITCSTRAAAAVYPARSGPITAQAPPGCGLVVGDCWVGADRPACRRAPPAPRPTRAAVWAGPGRLLAPRPAGPPRVSAGASSWSAISDIADRKRTVGAQAAILAVLLPGLVAVEPVGA